MIARMIRHTFLYLSLFLGLCAYSAAPVFAAEDAPSAKTAKSTKKAKGDKKSKGKKSKGDKEDAQEEQTGAEISGKVGEVLATLQVGTDTLNETAPATDADFYIYLTSASWCGPCNAEMPHVVEQYKRMREDGRVELILVSGDRDPNAAKGFMNKYGASFPAVEGPTGSRLPGFTPPSGIPNAIFVDKDGNVITNGHGQQVMSWESLTVNNPEYAGKISAPGSKAKADKPEKGGKDKKDADSEKGNNAVAAALKKLKPFNAKPSAKADYYIYLQSASWCGPCNNEMPSVVNAYKDMKKSGRVEIILVSHDKTEGDAKGFLKQYKAKFPAVMVQDSKIDTLPGFTKPNGIPNAIFVDSTGKVIMQGHGSLIQSWKQYTIDKD